MLGSGLGPFADEARDAIAVPYADIPGFPVPTVEGHAGRLVVGVDRRPAGRAVSGPRPLLRARRRQCDARAIEAFRRLGGETLILTNAAGGLKRNGCRRRSSPITDHINFAGANPLIGYSGADRFVPLTRAYDPDAHRRAA